MQKNLKKHIETGKTMINSKLLNYILLQVSENYAIILADCVVECDLYYICKRVVF